MDHIGPVLLSVCSISGGPLDAREISLWRNQCLYPFLNQGGTCRKFNGAGMEVETCCDESRAGLWANTKILKCQQVAPAVMGCQAGG
jgi:hypothetical protein